MEALNNLKMFTKLYQVCLTIVIIAIRISEGQPNGHNEKPIVHHNDLVNIVNAKILWQTENLVMIKRVDKFSSEALGKNASFQLSDMEEELLTRYSGVGIPDISKTCRKAHAFLCLKETCKWIREKCDTPEQYRSSTFPMTFPNSFDELIQMYDVTWENPPAVGHPLIWIAFLGSIMALGGFVILRSIVWAAMWCYRKATFKKRHHADIRKLLGKKLELALPTGHNIAISGYEIGATTDNSKITLVMSRTPQNEFLASTILGIERRVNTVVACNRYFSSGDSLTPVNGRFVWDDCCRSLTDSKTTDATDNFSAKCYLNDGFSCCSGDAENANVVSGDSIEGAAAALTGSPLSDNPTSAQPPPLPERKLITPGKMWTSDKRIVTAFSEGEPGVCESAF